MSRRTSASIPLTDRKWMQQFSPFLCYGNRYKLYFQLWPQKMGGLYYVKTRRNINEHQHLFWGKAATISLVACVESSMALLIKVDSSWTASLPLIWVGLCNEMAGMILQTYCCIHLTGLFTMPHAVMQMCFPMWRVRWYLIEAPHMHRCCWTWLRMTSLWDDAELLISLLLKHLLWTAVAWWWPVFIKTLENYTRDTCIILTKGLMLSHLIWNQNTACVFEQGFDSCTDTLPDPPA